jgi:hypothetical protein
MEAFLDQIAQTQAPIPQQKIAILYVERDLATSTYTIQQQPYKTTIDQAFELIVEETNAQRRRIGSIRLVSLEDWSDGDQKAVFASGTPIKIYDQLSERLQAQPITHPLLVVRWTDGMTNGGTTTTRTTKTQKELHAEQLSVAYVVKNPDGSFSTVNIHRTTVQAAWTTVVQETRSHQNQIVDMRMAPRDMWGKENVRRRDVYSKATPVRERDNLCDLIQQARLSNPLLLVCWDRPVQTPHKHNPKMCCPRKCWQYYIFTNGNDPSCGGGPVVLVHSANGIGQLDEQGILSVGSSKFLRWLTEKTQKDGWEVVSLTDEAASVRLKV